MEEGSRYAQRFKTPEERFWEKVDKTEGCWLWTGHINPNGYGLFRISPQERVNAHRFAYQITVGPIPEGLTLDHLCRVRHCVRPDHLEAVTSRENLMRGESIQAANAIKKHCPKGHPYDEANTRWYQGKRYCRACDRGRMARRRKERA